jgi:hypothetical protein
MPVGQLPAQLPAANGAHADPGGNPSFRQSASRLQVVHALVPTPNAPQKELSAVVRVQPQSVALLQRVSARLTASQTVGVAWAQVPVPWARHRFRPGLPRQMPEQHWRWRRQGSLTSRQPNRFGFTGFGRLRGLRRFGVASARVGNPDSPRPSPIAATPRSTSRRDGTSRRITSTPGR